MRTFELFAGIGAFKKGFSEDRLVGFSEVDKYAIKSYCAIHEVDEALNYGDITKIDAPRLPDFDLLTWGFPCQDISVAGNQKGIIQGETRSGLYYEGLRILKAKLPKYSIIENVKNLTGKKFKSQFDAILNDLKSLGYTNYWKVLNLKDYGIPQNRERVFIVSIRGEHKPFEFEDGFDNGLRLKDFLESEVDEKYYINSSKVEMLLSQLDYENKDKLCVDMTINQPKFKYIGNCIKARYDAGIVNQRSEGIGVVIPCLTPDRTEIRQKGRRFKEDGEPMFTLTGQDRHGILEKVGCIGADSQGNRVYSADGLAVAQCGTAGGLGAKTGLYAVKEATIMKIDVPQTVSVRKHEVDIAGLQNLLRSHKIMSSKSISELLNVPLTMVEHWFRTDNCFSIPDADIWFKLKEILEINSTEFDSQVTEFEERDGVFEKSNRCYLDEGISPTLTSTSADEKIISNYRIRKLTPTECWRLMGFDDADIQKCIDVGISNAQLYKMAGNSIGVPICKMIARQIKKTIKGEKIMRIMLELNQDEANAIFELAKTFTVDRIQTANIGAGIESARVQEAPVAPQVSQSVVEQVEPMVVAITSAPQNVISYSVAAPVVPTTPETYTMEQLAVAATQLVDAGRRQELVNLLGSFGVQALTHLPKENYGAFATQLRAMGAKL